MPAKRVLISIDERILARIDDAAQRTGQTRSGFLAQAAMAQIEGPRNTAALERRAARPRRPREAVKRVVLHPSAFADWFADGSTPLRSEFEAGSWT